MIRKSFSYSVGQRPNDISTCQRTKLHASSCFHDIQRLFTEVPNCHEVYILVKANLLSPFCSTPLMSCKRVE